MGANHTLEKFLYLDTTLSQRQPDHTQPRQFAFRVGESKKLKFTITPGMMSFYNDDGKLTLERGGC